MLGIDTELEDLYEKAQQNGIAVIKGRWTPGNYGCCSTRAPLVEKYKIEHSSSENSLYIWGTLVVTTNFEKQSFNVNSDYPASNYDKKIIDWFIQKSK